jgi:hypothetical protein
VAVDDDANSGGSSSRAGTAPAPVVEVLEVFSRADATDQLVDFAVDHPVVGAKSDRFALHVDGWVLGRSSPAKAVEVYYQDRLIRTLPLDYPRRGLVKSHPEFADENTCGFNDLVGVIGFSPEFTLNLRAVLEDDTSVPFRTIRARHEPLRTDFDPKLQPIMLTSLPRTGTTRLMRMLAVHPKVVVYRHFPYEQNNAEYWAHMLKVLAEPGNTVESSTRELHRDFWWVGSNPFYDRHADEDDELGRWFGRTYVERMGAFCQQSMDDLYSRVARKQDQPDAAYFAEKHRPGQLPTLLWELYPRAKEIVLARDPRDMLCSVFNFWPEDHGERGRARDDRQFVEWLGGSALELYKDWEERSSRAHLVRYEDSVLEPVETLTALLEYLEVDSSPEIVEEMLRAAGTGTPKNFPQHQTSGTPEASVGRWRRDLEPSLREASEAAFAPVLSGFGYSA